MAPQAPAALRMPAVAWARNVALIWCLVWAWGS